MPFLAIGSWPSTALTSKAGPAPRAGGRRGSKTQKSAGAGTAIGVLVLPSIVLAVFPRAWLLALRIGCSSAPGLVALRVRVKTNASASRWRSKQLPELKVTAPSGSNCPVFRSILRCYGAFTHFPHHVARACVLVVAISSWQHKQARKCGRHFYTSVALLKLPLSFQSVKKYSFSQQSASCIRDFLHLCSLVQGAELVEALKRDRSSKGFGCLGLL